MKTSEVVKVPAQPARRRRGRGTSAAQQQQPQQQGPSGGGDPLDPLPAPQQQQQQQEQPPEDQLHPVLCANCDTEVGLRDTADGVYHFFHAVASNS